MFLTAVSVTAGVLASLIVIAIKKIKRVLVLMDCEKKRESIETLPMWAGSLKPHLLSWLVFRGL